MDIIKVQFGFYTSATNKELEPFNTITVEEGFGQIVNIKGHTFCLEVRGSAKCNGKNIFADVTTMQPRVEVADGIYAQVKVMLPPLPRRIHPQGLTCSDCMLWSHEKGVEELNHVTQVFDANRELKLQKEVIDQMAITYGKPIMSDANVGYCPKKYSLTCDISPACMGDFIAKPKPKSNEVLS